MFEYNRSKLLYIFVTPAGTSNSNRTANRGRVNLQAAARQQEVSLSSIGEANGWRRNNPQGRRDQEDQPNQFSPSSGMHDDLAGTGSRSKSTLPEKQVHLYIRDTEPSSRNSPEPSHIDQEGHYIGPTSGVSLLSRALKKLHETGHSVSATQQTSIFNFADAPVPPYDPCF